MGKRRAIKTIGVIVMLLMLTATVILGGAAILFFMEGESGAPSVFGYNIYLVRDNDFYQIKARSAAVSSRVDVSSVNPGEIIIFHRYENNIAQMGHVEEILRDGDSISFSLITENMEEIIIPADKYIARVQYYSEIMGEIIGFAMSPFGVIAIAVLPCLAVLTYEFIRYTGTRAAAKRAANEQELKGSGFFSEENTGKAKSRKKPDTDKKSAKPAASEKIVTSDSSAKHIKSEKLTVPENSAKHTKSEKLTAPENSVKPAKSEKLTVPENSAKHTKSEKLTVPENSAKPVKSEKLTVPESSAKPEKTATSTESDGLIMTGKPATYKKSDEPVLSVKPKNHKTPAFKAPVDDIAVPATVASDTAKSDITEDKSDEKPDIMAIASDLEQRAKKQNPNEVTIDDILADLERKK